MEMKRSLLIIWVLITYTSLWAQPHGTENIYRPYKWMFGLHWNFIEDDGSKFEDIFDVSNSWNALPYPAKLTIDRYFKYGWSMEFGLSYASYSDSKRINDTTGLSGMNFAFDVNGKFSLYNIYAPRHRWFEPYFTFGVGYTYRDITVDPHVPTVNLGGGINFWIVKRIGIQIASQAKFACYPTVWETHGNYLQHSIGIVYRTPWETGYQYPNNKKQHKWTKEQQRYKRKGGH